MAGHRLLCGFLPYIVSDHQTRFSFLGQLYEGMPCASKPNMTFGLGGTHGPSQSGERVLEWIFKWLDEEEMRDFRLAHAKRDK